MLNTFLNAATYAVGHDAIWAELLPARGTDAEQDRRPGLQTDHGRGQSTPIKFSNYKRWNLIKKTDKHIQNLIGSLMVNSL